MMADLEPAPGPEARCEQHEPISLAFITALQLLPPRQLAVLLLRDVLGYPATTAEAVTSALKRARAAMRQDVAGLAERKARPAAGSPEESAIAEKFVRAYESSDVDGIINLLTDDVFLSMPPMPFEYEGKPIVAQFRQLLFSADRRYRLVPTRANGAPAVGAYVRSADGLLHATGLFVITLRGNQISALTRFENTVLRRFGLPRTLPTD